MIFYIFMVLVCNLYCITKLRKEGFKNYLSALNFLLIKLNLLAALFLFVLFISLKYHL